MYGSAFEVIWDACGVTWVTWISDHFGDHFGDLLGIKVLLAVSAFRSRIRGGGLVVLGGKREARTVLRLVRRTRVLHYLTRLRPTGGRADCLLFALPAEAFLGFDAWRIRGIEITPIGEKCIW